MPRCLSVLFIVLSIALPTAAGEIALRWDPSPGATGYRIYFGNAPGNYDNFVDVGTATSATLRTPEDCRDYHVAVKAYNQFGESVGFSNEVSGPPRPEVDRVSPLVVRQGDQALLEIRGGNFTTGGSATIDVVGGTPTDLNGGELIRFDSIAAVSCDRLELLVTVEPGARGLRAMPLGPLRLQTRYTSGEVVGGNVLPFVIAFDPYRADVNRVESESIDRVDGADLAWISYAHGSAEGDGNFLPDADLTGDGLVDGNDLALMSTFFAECWTGAGWSGAAC